MPAYYRSTIETFLDDDSDRVIGTLVSAIAKSGFVDHKNRQTTAWEKQINVLKTTAETLVDESAEFGRWGLLLEYPIPRRQKRIDLVLLARDVILCVEFKTDAKTHTLQARKQAEDYALDLRDFHEESRGRRIVPIAVSTDADDVEHLLSGFYPDLVRPTIITNESGLAGTFSLAFRSQTDTGSEPIDIIAWDLSAYRPVPTIIEAAETLYAQHDVSEIAHSHAGDENLKITSQRIIALIKRAQNRKEKIACFVTGIPGAGKTLAA